MKKLFIILSLFCAGIVKSQAPEKLNYQGIARDALGNVITTPIGIKFEIHQGSASGPVVYDETHTINPSSVGVFTAAIGGGAVGSGNFSTISWGTNSYFLTVNLDPAGGTSYSTVGTSQLLSVPYALYAKTSGNASTTYSAGNGISISSGSIINTAMNQTVNISGGGGTTVSGAYPSYTITSSTSTSIPTSSLQINTPHNITTLGPNNYSITVQPTNISGAGVSGSYPNYSIASSPSTSITAGSTNVIVSGTAPAYTINALPPVITGTGVTTVTASANNFTISTPATKLTYTPTTGILSYSPAIGINTINILPAVSFTNNVLTVGTTTTSIPVTGIWTRPSNSVTTLTNANDNVGIGTAIPNNRLDVLESANGIAAVNAVNTYTTVSAGSAMGLWAEANNPNGSSAAVYAVHNGGGNGVSGISNTTTYSNTAGVYGYATGTSSTNVSIQADVAMGNSTGIFANSFAGHNGIALYSLKAGSAGNAAKIEITNTANSADALFATTNGLGASIHAVNGPTVAGSSNITILSENGHIQTVQSVKPTIVMGSALGGGSSSINGAGTDTAGEILFNTGSPISGTSPFELVRVTFNKSYNTMPVVVVTARNSTAGNLNVWVAPTATGFSIYSNALPPTFSNHQYFYFVIGK
jgi:hypothetical protein